MSRKHWTHRMPRTAAKWALVAVLVLFFVHGGLVLTAIPSVITLGGEPEGVLLIPGWMTIGCVVPSSSGMLEDIRRKLLPENRVNVGSTTSSGVVFPTRAQPYSILEVINAYLKEPLTADELSFILEHRGDFAFSLGVGDRRKEFVSRYTVVDNWCGEDVEDFEVLPEVYGKQPYGHRLWFDARAGTVRLTDTHSGTNKYGSLRALVIEEINRRYGRASFS
ncbi:TPA: hypothetical protein ACH6CC_004556 [Escherichia coli]|nr:hypothetical protein [Escherichia coli]EFK5224871.1 hypothetical protein [Escherichia coli]HDW2890363.1 hypothetical protein [Escherichia coli]